MATRNSNRAPQNRTQSFYGRSKNAPASLQLSTRGRKSQPLRDQYNITSSATGSERTNSTRALKPRVWSEYDGGFDGYRHGMRLNDAKPTPMYSSSGDETGTGEEGDETEGMGLRRRGDDVLLSLHEAKDSGRRQIMDSTSPGMTFDQFYSAQPTQMQPRHQISGDQDVIALLQSQQASLDKVRLKLMNYVHVLCVC